MTLHCRISKPVSAAWFRAKENRARANRPDAAQYRSELDLAPN
jgi:hypothetical protein